MIRKTAFLLVLITFWACTPVPHKPKAKTADKPNIILIMADDMGYSDPGFLGGDIATPYLDSLAKTGVVMLHFYNNAKCYPSRASLLTGLYPHRTGLGRSILHLNEPKGKNGPFQGWLSHTTPTIAELLKKEGYRCYISGKWHVGEKKEDWPLQRGFDRYFGLVSGASSYFELLPQPPSSKRIRQMLLDNKHFIPPDSGFYMTDAISDFAIRCIRENPVDTPFFLYVAYTAPHWPLHALEKDMENYKGKFDMGWDSARKARIKHIQQKAYFPKDAPLPQKPISVTDWDAVENKEEWSRRMEVYAAMVNRMDQGIGRIWKAIQQLPDPENTIIVFLSDNGPSAENIEHRQQHTEGIAVGLPGSYRAYNEPWAYVSNAPYQNYKLTLNEGGLKTPLLLYWPVQIKSPKILEASGHIIDLVPTLLSAIGMENPGLEFDGKSLLTLIQGKHFDLQDRPIFWEYNGHKAMLQGDYKILKPQNTDKWQVYNLQEDPCETKDIADTEGNKMVEMIKLYEEWEGQVMWSLMDTSQKISRP